MTYDIIFITGEIYFDHPLCGVAILKRLLEKKGYSVGIIEKPTSINQIKIHGKPNLFFAVTSGSIDSMVRNYTPLKKLRIDDKNLNYNEIVPDRAVIVYSNWVKQLFKDSIIVLGGTEASLRRFTHYDYWQNRLRKPILFDSRADIICFGSAEKQIIEITNKIKNNQPLINIKGTCIVTKEINKDATILPSFDEVTKSKEKFCDMQNLLSNNKNLIQKIDNRYILQYKSPVYTSKDLDEYYELSFTRSTPKELRGFEFSVVTHRGCIANCNFCSLVLLHGNKIISRSKDSILNEIKKITKLKNFKGNIDDLGGPSANMYGMDCDCDIKNKDCMKCSKLDKTNKKLLDLLKKSRAIKGVNNIYIKSGIMYHLCSKDYIKEIAKHHTFDTIRIAPEHVNKNILKLMNKDYGDLKEFQNEFNKHGKELSYYFIMAHPGSSMKESHELANEIKKLKNANNVQIFTPTPMTVSTCMYYTGLNPKTKEKIYVPYSYNEKKQQKRIIFD
jgi:uncharacterized radical SAM protein YgiQ